VSSNVTPGATRLTASAGVASTPLCPKSCANSVTVASTSSARVQSGSSCASRGLHPALVSHSARLMIPERFSYGTNGSASARRTAPS
jgi:hypothetical protein